MRVIADLHLHSRFSRACSKDLTLENNAYWCEKKGVSVLGTADFTHPMWFKEISSKLVEDQGGLYRLKNGNHPGVRFMMTTEVSQIYKKYDKVRRIHNVILAPSIEVVAEINKWLDKNEFNRKSDGRPILGIDSEKLYKELRKINNEIIIIPAHIWTPWFSVFGSKSGFDTLEECFGEMTEYIYAVETGLSSDPLMNRSLSALDNLMLVSNSDAHSPRNFGREANVFEINEKDLSYSEFIRIFKDRDLSKFKYTIEFYPEEGKYHTDGHAKCNFYCSPEETKRLKGICPKCKKPLTIGVLSRVQDLADRKLIKKMPKNQVPFKSIVPLQNIIAKSFGIKSTNSKKVQLMYEQMIAELGAEFEILLDKKISDIEGMSNVVIAESIRRMRAGKMYIRPGYDGLFGDVEFFDKNDPAPSSQQVNLL